MRLLLVALIAALVAACAATTASPSGPGPDASGPASTGSTAPSPAPTSVPVSPGSSGEPPGGPSGALEPTRTETEWGPIWDQLPPSFPAYPGAIPAETRAGAVTAELAIPTDPASTVAWYRTALEAAGYRTEAVSEPLEDGSVVIDSVGATPGCRVEVKILPLSGTTHATIMFGANCPFG